MSVFSDLLAKAKQLEIEIAKEGTVLVGDAATVLSDLVENLQHEVNKEVSAPPANTATGEPTPNADGAEQAAEAEKADTPAAPEAPADPAAGVQNTSDLAA